MSTTNGKPIASGSPFSRAAPTLFRSGYRPIPIIPGEKIPGNMRNGRWVKKLAWSTAKPSESDINLWSSYDGAGVGVILGDGLVAVDIDTDDERMTAAILELLPEPTVKKRGAKGFTAFYRDPTGKICTRRFRRADGVTLCEVLAGGSQTVIPPSVHPVRGVPYEYQTAATLENTRPEDLPEAPEDLIGRLEVALAPWLNKERIPVWAGSFRQRPGDGDRMRAWAEGALSNEVHRLAVMQPNTGRNNQLFSAACALGKYVHHGILPEKDVTGVLLDACEQCGLIKDDGYDQCLQSIKSGLKRAVNDPLPNLSER